MNGEDTAMKSMPANCSECKSSGKCSKLKLSFLSLSTGIWLCSDPKCCFPLNSSKVDDFIVKIDRKMINPLKSSARRSSCEKYSGRVGSVKGKKKYNTLSSSASSDSSLVCCENKDYVDAAPLQEPLQCKDDISVQSNKRAKSSSVASEIDGQAIESQMLPDGRNSKLDSLTVISGSSSSTLSDGISSRRTPVEKQNPVYLRKWLNKIDCNANTSENFEMDEEVETHSDNVIKIKKYLPFVPRRDQHSSLEEKDTNEDIEPGFLVLESKLVDDDLAFEGKKKPMGLGHCFTDEPDSAYSSPLNYINSNESLQILKNEPLPVSANGFNFNADVASVLDMVDHLFDNGDEILTSSKEEAISFLEPNYSSFDFEIDISKL